MLLGFLNHLPGYSASFDLANLCAHTVIIIFIRMAGRKSTTGEKVARILQFWQAFITQNYTWVLWTHELLQDWVKYSLSFSCKSQKLRGKREGLFSCTPWKVSFLKFLIEHKIHRYKSCMDTKRRQPDELDREDKVRILLGHQEEKEFTELGAVTSAPGYHREGTCLSVPRGDWWPGSCAFPTELLQWGIVCGHEDNED